MLAAACWVAEFLLESSGAYLAWRKRLNVLSALLGFRALADISSFAIARTWGGNAYGVALWICLGVQYLLLICLAVQMLRELLLERHKPFAPFAGLFAIVVGMIVGLVAVQGETVFERFLDGGIAANATLGMILALGWVWRTVGLTGASRWIAAGLVVTFLGNGLCTMLWRFWAGAPQLYPFGAILALLIWNLAGWRAQVEPREFLRLSLGTRVPNRTMWLDRSAEGQIN